MQLMHSTLSHTFHQRNTHFLSHLQLLSHHSSTTTTTIYTIVEQILATDCVPPALATIQFPFSIKHAANLNTLIQLSQHNATALLLSFVHILETYLTNSHWTWNQQDGTFSPTTTERHAEHDLATVLTLLFNGADESSHNFTKQLWVWQLISQLPKLTTAGFTMELGLVWPIQVVVHYQREDHQQTLVVLEVHRSNGSATRQLHRGTWKGTQCSQDTLVWEMDPATAETSAQTTAETSNGLQSAQNTTTMVLTALHFQHFQLHPQTRRELYQGRNLILVGSESSTFLHQLLQCDPGLHVARIQPNTSVAAISHDYFPTPTTANNRMEAATEDTFDRCFFTLVMFTEEWVLDVLLFQKTTLHDFIRCLSVSCPEVTRALLVIRTRNRDVQSVRFAIKEYLMDRRSERTEWEVRCYSPFDNRVVFVVCPVDYPHLTPARWEEMTREGSVKGSGGGDSGGDSGSGNRSNSCSSSTKLFQPRSISLAQAQPTSVIRLPSLLSLDEVQQIIAWGDSELFRSNQCDENSTTVAAVAAGAGIEDRGTHAKHWKVVYLQTKGMFSAKFPTIIPRIRKEINTIDSKHWNNIVQKNGKYGENDLQARVVEYHRQNAPGPGLSDERHYDMDSCITVDIALSNVDDFDGGELCTLEVNGETIEHVDVWQGPGDAAVFVSHKFHSVNAITRGVRRVLVLEFWRGPERTCNHRCESLSIVCDREMG